MTCDINCTYCQVTGGTVSIDQSSLSYPSTASPGDSITIQFDITCGLTVPTSTAIVCLYNTSYNPPTCLTSAVQTNLAPACRQHVTLVTTMDTKNMNLNLSLSARFATFQQCQDTYNFTITAVPPAGQGYSCDPTTKTCISDPNSTITYDQCYVNCTGKPSGNKCQSSGDCGSDSFCVVGYCVPKPFVLIGAAALLIMLMGRGGGK